MAIHMTTLNATINFEGISINQRSVILCFSERNMTVMLLLMMKNEKLILVCNNF